MIKPHYNSRPSPHSTSYGFNKPARYIKNNPRANSEIDPQESIDKCLNCDLDDCRANTRGQCPLMKNKQSTTPGPTPPRSI